VNGIGNKQIKQMLQNVPVCEDDCFQEGGNRSRAEITKCSLHPLHPGNKHFSQV